MIRCWDCGHEILDEPHDDGEHLFHAGCCPDLSCLTLYFGIPPWRRAITMQPKEQYL